MRFLPMSHSEEEKWFEALQLLKPEERILAIDIRSGEDWRHVGSCGLFNFNYLARNAELGILIGEKSQWDHGFGTEAMELLLKHAFHTLNLNRVFLRVFESNGRAQRVYKKVGFIEEGRLREDQYRNGSFEATILMGILREEWETSE